MVERRARDAWWWAETASTTVVVLLVWAYLLSYFKPELLFLDTMDAGGDTPSFLGPIHHLRDVLLPAGNPLGNFLGNFAGYAPYQYYFLPPSLTIVLLSYVIPLNVAFKVVTVVGVFLLPVAALVTMRALRYPFPVPALAAASMLLFLFNEGNSMWGGNIPSTLAGEFAHSIGFSLALLFVGLLYSGIERERGWRSRAWLLAVCGLSHPVAFLNATTPGLFFLLHRRTFVRNLRFIVLVYGTATLLMGFWLVPLMAKIGYATSINWKWHFNSWRDVLPPIMVPIAIMAALDVVWIFSRRRLAKLPGFDRITRGLPEEDQGARYLFFAAITSVVWFLNGTEVGLPEIRFVPFCYVLMVLMSVDLIQRVLPITAPQWRDAGVLRIAPYVGMVALLAGCWAWQHKNTTFVQSWIRWNYSGLERKPSWPLLKAITKAVSGTVNDPRIVYENSPQHDRFGSMRVFEDLPLLSGRGTLEGVLLQTGLTSPFVYFIQSQVSKQGTGVIPGYSYPTVDPQRATPRLDLFNVHDYIVLTPEVKKALADDPRWKKVFDQHPYEIYRRQGATKNFVRVPKFEPVLFESEDWKHAFHAWFSKDVLLDVPLVEASRVPESERGRFGQAATDLSKLPRVAVEGECAIEERVDHMDISFTTTCPGKPHWIAVTWFPNWQVEGASHVFLASPAFMLVYPEGNEVRLTYRRLFVDWLGLGLSVLAIGMCLARPVTESLTGALARLLGPLLETLHTPLVVIVSVGIIAVTAWHSARDWGPRWFYQRGWAAFEKGDYPTSQREFAQAMFLGGDANTAADATFFHGASLLRQGKPAEAQKSYQRVVDEFPNSIWVAESHYHVGLCLRQQGLRDEARKRFQFVLDEYPGNRWAGFAEEQMQQMDVEDGKAAPPTTTVPAPAPPAP
jgi:hypothetical protein